MVVKKAVKMAETLAVPLLGLVENMSYVTCPRCGERIDVFGPSRAERAAQDLGLTYIGGMPIDPALTALADRGAIEQYQSELGHRIASRLAYAEDGGK